MLLRNDIANFGESLALFVPVLSSSLKSLTGYTWCGLGPFLISLPAIGIAIALKPNISTAANN